MIFQELISESKVFSNLRSENIEEHGHSRLIIPTWLDWRAQHVITPVVNQSIMGSAPAIVATEVIESFQAVFEGKNVTKGSADQVAACCGSVIDVLDCVLNATGGKLCTQESYTPFNGTCKPTGCETFVDVIRFDRILFTIYLSIILV